MNNASFSEQDQGILREVDSALAAEPLLTPAGAKARKALPPLPQVLRGMGALVLLSAAAVFLVQECDVVTNHMARFYSFLGFTGVLAVIGFFCGLRLKEDKGARTFLALAAAMVPANFCQLGALIYSRLTESAQSVFPAYAQLQAPSNQAAAVAAIVGTTVLGAVSLISFSALARRHAREAGFAFMAANLLLIVPTRDAAYIGPMLLLAAMGMALLERNRFAADSAMKTTEGTLLRALLGAPVALLAIRSLHLYEATPGLAGMVFAAVAASLLIGLRPHAKTVPARDSITHFATVPAIVASLLLSGSILAEPAGTMSNYATLIMLLPISVVFAGISLLLTSGRREYQAVAVSAMTAGFVGQMLVFPTIIISFLAITAGVLGVAGSYAARNRFSCILAAVLLVSGLSHHLHLARALYLYSPWLSLAVLGTLTVLAASYIERNHVQLRARLAALHAHFD